MKAAAGLMFPRPGGGLARRHPIAHATGRVDRVHQRPLPSGQAHQHPSAPAEWPNAFCGAAIIRNPFSLLVYDERLEYDFMTILIPLTRSPTLASLFTRRRPSVGQSLVALGLLLNGATAPALLLPLADRPLLLAFIIAML
jgi:hypothetical protein